MKKNAVKSSKRIDNLSNNAVYIVAILTNQGMKCMKVQPKQFPLTRLYRNRSQSIGIGTFTRLKSTSFFIAAGVWCLMALIVVNAYAGNLISYLAVPKLKPVIQSFEDLVENKDLQLAVEANTLMANRFLVGTVLTYTNSLIFILIRTIFTFATHFTILK